MSSLLPKSVNIFDDTMREGLQIESPDIPVAEKLRLLDAIGEMGAKTITVGSFAHPKWTPSMACIDEIAEQFEPKPGINYTAAVFNKRGYDRADGYFPKINVRGRKFGTHVELCDTFARRNYNRTQAEPCQTHHSFLNRESRRNFSFLMVFCKHCVGDTQTTC